MKRFFIILSDLVRIFLLLLKRNKSIAYGSCLKESNNILVLCSKEMDITNNSIIDQISRLFKKTPLTVLHYSNQKKHNNSTVINYISIPQTTNSFLPLLHQYSVLPTLETHHYDTVLDLDPDFNLFHLCLCVHLKPSLRIGFQESHMNRVYNLLYKTSTENGQEKKLTGLIKFLNNIISIQ